MHRGDNKSFKARVIVGRLITIQGAIEKRNYELIYKTDTKIRATTLAIANLRATTVWEAIEKNPPILEKITI